MKNDSIHTRRYTHILRTRLHDQTACRQIQLHVQSHLQLSEVISMQQPEQRLGKRIQLYCGRINWLCIRYNTGKVQDAKTGKWIDFGPPTGHSDYIVYTDDGRAIFIETKIHPRKPTQEQLDWIDTMRSRGFGAYVIYSLEEFITTVVGSKEVGK